MVQMSMVVFFALETRRVDGRQGPIARQIPAVLAQAWADAGVASRYAGFTATRGDAVAHVLLEQPLPDALIGAECHARGAQRAVTGRVVYDDGRCELALRLVDVSGGEVLAHVAGNEAHALSLRETLLDVAAQLAGALGVEPVSLELPASDDALVAWLIHLDNAALGPRGFRSTEIAARWRWAIETLRLDRDFAPAARAARTLVESLGAEGHASEALSCALELAELTAQSQDWSRAIGRLPDGARPLIEKVLRQSRDVAMSADVQLQLGVAALRASMAEQAQKLLESASNEVAVRDRALAYLGVALAERGQRDEAIAIWNDVLARGSDESATAIARSNLERATTRGA